MVRSVNEVSRLLLVVAFVGSAIFLSRPTAHATTTLTVTTTADLAPPCATDVSLRCALTQANLDGSGDTIAFDIPAADPGCLGTPVVCTILLLAPLPTLTANDTTIDGYTQPGARANTNPLRLGDNAVIVIRLEGSQAGAGVDGLTLAGTGNLVRGLAITGFRLATSPIGVIRGGNGISLLGSGNLVQGNFIGVAPDGRTAVPNQFAAVNVVSAVGQETIGGSSPAHVNVLSGNGHCSVGDCVGFGVYVSAGSGTVIAGNAIGVSASGTTALGNAATGVVVLSPRNTLGGAAPGGAGNVISGNGGDGADVDSTGNLVAGNLIGTNAAGTARLGNAIVGLSIQGASNTVVGNLVSGNGATGVSINGSGNVIRGNRIGTDAAGTLAIGNGFGSTARINGDQGLTACFGGNTIGGAAPGQGNLISGNHGTGLGLPSSNNTVLGNQIGTNAAGTAALANGGHGIALHGICSQAPSNGGTGNVIGGGASGAGNVVSGNRGDGIRLIAGRANVVAGNRIGTNAAGTAALANHGDGIVLMPFCDERICTPSSSNLIGGTASGAGNIVSGNVGNGIRVSGTGGGVSNTIQGNQIGTDVTGSVALGNGNNGVWLLNGAVNDSVGGTEPGAGNTIAYNALSGVLVGASSADQSHSPVQENAIFANGGLGIDLAPQGAVNCATPPPGPNDYTACPILTAASTSQVSGTACAGCTVEVYLATNGAEIERSGDPADQGHGEGASFLGSAIANDSGAWTLSLAPGQVSVGQLLTATATTPVAFNRSAETSEFAANIVVGT